MHEEDKPHFMHFEGTAAWQEGFYITLKDQRLLQVGGTSNCQEMLMHEHAQLLDICMKRWTSQHFSDCRSVNQTIHRSKSISAEFRGLSLQLHHADHAAAVSYQPASFQTLCCAGSMRVDHCAAVAGL